MIIVFIEVLLRLLFVFCRQILYTIAIKLIGYYFTMKFNQFTRLVKDLIGPGHHCNGAHVIERKIKINAILLLNEMITSI